MLEKGHDHHKKNKYALATGHSDNFVPLESLDLSKVHDADDLLRAMSRTSFGGRRVGEAADVLYEMIQDKDCLKVLTLSGAMTVAKMGLVICDMIDQNYVDVVVSTGALMAHGFIEAVGMQHFKYELGEMDDEELYEKGYDRVYDTLELETNLDDAEIIVKQALEKFRPGSKVCSHLLNHELGKYLAENTKGRGVLTSAYRKKVPVFIPAFTDSEFGLDFALFNRRKKMENKEPLHYDPFMDLDAYADIVFKAKKLGIFTIGGGVPRNWAQQVGPYLDIIQSRIFNKAPLRGNGENKENPYNKKFSYATRICPEPDHWGGLSGCSYSEGVSWGKFVPKSHGGKFAEVYADATVAWPLVIKAVQERVKKNKVVISKYGQ